jgi:hypothetical protein
VETTERFPSVSVPRWVRVAAWLGSMPSWLFAALVVFSLSVHLFSGFGTYFLTRSKDRWSHLGGGAAVGFIAAIVAFTFVIGPGFVLSEGVIHTFPDIQLLTDGYRTNGPTNRKLWDEDEPVHPQERLVKKYPELAELPEDERAGMILPKTTTTHVVGIYQGIAFGMALSLLVFVPLGIGGTAIAGAIVRRRARLALAVVPYAEVNSAFSILFVYVVLIAFAMTGVWGIGWFLPALPGFWGISVALLIVASAIGVLWGWGWRIRLRIVGCGFGACVCLWLMSQSLFGVLAAVLAFTPVYLVLLWMWVKRRRGEPSASGPPESIPQDAIDTKTLTPAPGAREEDTKSAP